MNESADASLFQVVRNEENQASIWPDYRKGTLPAGWSFAGFSGRRDECLSWIAGQAVVPPPPAMRPESPRQNVGTQACAVPFPRPNAPRRLFVFPHAGAGASYYHFLARALKDDALEVQVVQYPGREMRVKEPPLADMDAMTALLDDELESRLAEKPFAFFGHSMGALTAFELARRRGAEGATLPRHLFLSGRQAPQIPGNVLHVEGLDDAAFLDAVGRRYNALPAELLANPEIVELILPVLRADFRLMERYRYREAAPLDVPITLLNGCDDRWVTAESLAAWQLHSRRPLQERMFAGGHFYLPAAVSEVRAVVLGA